MRKRIILSSYGVYLGKKGDMLVIKRGDGKRVEVSVGNIGRV